MLDATAVSALPGEAALKSVRVATVAAPAKITCAKRLGVLDGLYVMRHI
jgi:hypothetical protein